MLFPTLSVSEFGRIQLNAVAQEYFTRHGAISVDQNPFLDPEACLRVIQGAQKEQGVKYSYGGWLEDRSTLWRGSYLETQQIFTHLGVDFTVPERTPISFEHEGQVLRVDSDAPEEGGWGTRVIVRLAISGMVVIYAHLSEKILIQEGDFVMPGKVFARVGGPLENGGWFPHLHVQCVSWPVYRDRFMNNLSQLDGYGIGTQREELAEIFPDPLRHVFQERAFYDI